MLEQQKTSILRVKNQLGYKLMVRALITAGHPQDPQISNGGKKKSNIAQADYK